jgi:glycosyltransferase involved in cell wall biosynthesis
MKKVVHLIPFDGIGGVESSAYSIYRIAPADIEFSVSTVFSTTESLPGVLEKHIWAYPKSIKSILSLSPDALIVSLWRAYIVGIFIKIIKPKIKLIVFLHLPTNVHIVDSLATKVALFLSDAIWADSEATRRNRVPVYRRNITKVISFVTKKPEWTTIRDSSPVFIFWGRIHPQKGLLDSIMLFSEILKVFPEARYIIIGPDGGDLNRVKARLSELDIMHAVTLRGPLDFKDIVEESATASFYLQCSKVEGMAMSVVEAMQLGLVPVVKAVGEISSYAIHMKNSILIENIEDARLKILGLLHDRARFRRMSKAAMSTWSQKELYAENVVREVRVILYSSD